MTRFAGLPVLTFHAFGDSRAVHSTDPSWFDESLSMLAEAGFHHHRNAQVWPPFLQQPQGGRQQHDVADGAQANDQNARPGSEARKDASRLCVRIHRRYSAAIFASSTSMTGMSSLMG